MESDYKKLSNAELRIKLKEMEDEYNAVKNVISSNISKLNYLDEKYNKVKTILESRTKNRI